MNKIKLILICLIAIVATCAFCIGLIAMNEQVTNTKYVIYNFSDTCSVELPTNIKFTDKVGDYSSSSNVLGSNVNIESKSLFGNSEVSQITYSKSVVDGSTVGADLNNSGSNTINGKTFYHRTVMNEATGESVSVIGANKELVDYIADHVKFKDGKSNKTVNTTVEKVSNNNNNNLQNLTEVKEKNTIENPKYLQKDSNGQPVYTYKNGYYYATTNDGNIKGCGYDSVPEGATVK